jgi:hypothetical protein
MSNKKNNGGPAFPCTFYDRDSTGEYQPREQLSGMSLRDYFAAKAMQGMLSDPSRELNEYEVSRESYIIANAMLVEREK